MLATLTPAAIVAARDKLAAGHTISGHPAAPATVKRYLAILSKTMSVAAKEWFWMHGDKPRSEEALLNLFNACRTGGTNFLLNVPPDIHGLIPKDNIAALMRLRKNAGI